MKNKQKKTSLIVLIVLGGGLMWAYTQTVMVKNKTFLVEELEEAEKYFSFRNRLDTTVSRVDVAWHLDHLFKVINRIYDRLEQSKPDEYQWRPNALRSAVFTSGSMPRGAGKAPQSVRPPETILTDSLHFQLEEAKQKIRLIDSLASDANFVHPVFGQLNLRQSMRFMTIHSRHHLAIIKDIVGKKVG